MRRNLATGVALGLMVCLVGGGCGSSEPEPKQATTSLQHLRAIQKAYWEACLKLGRPPENVQEIMPFLRTAQGKPEDLLRSPDDGQEYKILWGVDFTAAEPDDLGRYLVIAYEQQGKDGRRYVAEARIGRIPHLSDEDFKKCLFPPGHRPPV